MQHMVGNDRGKNPFVKKLSLKSDERDGLSSGRSFKSFCIRLAADRETRDGIAYSLLRILIYVSFKQLVSNGGLPTSNVYLQKNAYNYEWYLKIPLSEY